MLRAAAGLACRARSNTKLPQICASAARGYAAESAPEQDTTPPITVHGIPGRYASALYTSAAKAGKLEAVQEELVEVYNLTGDSPEFEQFLYDPSIPKNKKVPALNAILDKMEVSDVTRHFLEVLARNNRLKHLLNISDLYDDLVAASKGEVRAKITTAQELEPEELEDIKASLKELLKPGENLLVEQMVDPRIMGGMVVDIGDKHIDMSISSRVKKIQQLVMQTV
ncbi:MAG: ATP synthase subunit mitochondrial [Trebouxia sp. A1-2]|nr:MAG: ATP synthase subunit mitochondrial [Trebouxia sp. A1-2]